MKNLKITKRIVISITLFLFLFAGIRGNGIIKEEKRELKSFNSIEISGSFKIVIEKSEQHSLIIKTDENLIGNIITEQKSNNLKIYTRENLWSESQIQITIFAENITEITSAGAGDIYYNNVNNGNLKLSVSGSSQVTLSGVTNNFSVEGSGAININAGKLIADFVEVNFNGACSGDVYVGEELEANLSGASTLGYSGNPVRVKSNPTGVSTLRKL